MDMTSSFQQYLHETGIGETLKESDMRANKGDPDGYGASGTNMDHKLHKEDVPMFTLDKVREFKKTPEKKNKVDWTNNNNNNDKQTHTHTIVQYAAEVA